jgi:hypothetical protein
MSRKVALCSATCALLPRCIPERATQHRAPASDARASAASPRMSASGAPPSSAPRHRHQASEHSVPRAAQLRGRHAADFSQE